MIQFYYAENVFFELTLYMAAEGDIPEVKGS